MRIIKIKCYLDYFYLNSIVPGLQLVLCYFIHLNIQRCTCLSFYLLAVIVI